MRVKRKSDGLTVLAVSGTYVVMLGFDLPKEKTAGLLGFAVARVDANGEVSWMRGTKTFAGAVVDHVPGYQVRSIDHPFQTFQWSDYSAEPGRTYRYRVVAVRGSPSRPRPSETVELEVKTEAMDSGRHAIFFNRGAVASQEYARRFLNQKPSEVPNRAAYVWLSRGLVEALIGFIGQATGGDFALRGAFYELKQPEVLAAFKEAKARGVDVQLLYDANGQIADNEEAIRSARIAGLCSGRVNAKIAHNKFLVLLRRNKPVAVWTGSTNLTENGIYGHSNLGHLVRDPEVANAFLELWTELAEDPVAKTMRDWTGDHTPVPPITTFGDTSVVFSPRKGLAALDWYASLAGGAERALMMTFAFGMAETFLDVYNREDGILKFALMEKLGINAAGREAVEAVRRRPNVVVAAGTNVAQNRFDDWLDEITQIKSEVNVRYVHTKFMLVDPLGPSPVVVTGSANFSKASTTDNDENMLIIRNNAAVADIYLGEFMRLHAHYAFREATRFTKRSAGGSQATPNLRPLEPDDAWISKGGYFTQGSDRSLRRTYFSGG
jgi:PLD-like domain